MKKLFISKKIKKTKSLFALLVMLVATLVSCSKDSEPGLDSGDSGSNGKNPFPANALYGEKDAVLSNESDAEFYLDEYVELRGACDTYLRQGNTSKYRESVLKLENELNKSIQLGRNQGSNIIFIKNGKFYTGTGHYYLNYKGSTSNVVGKINLMNPFGALYPNLNVDGVNYDGLLTITVVGENLELESDYSISGNTMITEYANYSFYSDDMNLYIDQDFLGITITYIYID